MGTAYAVPHQREYDSLFSRRHKHRQPVSERHPAMKISKMGCFYPYHKITIHGPTSHQASGHPCFTRMPHLKMLLPETDGVVPASQALSEYNNVCLHASDAKLVL